MNDFAEFKGWFDSELTKYPLLAKSNPISLNELCYVLRMSEFDFSVNWNTPTGFHSIPSVRETFVPSWQLAQKVQLDDYIEDGVGGQIYRHVNIKILEV